MILCMRITKDNGATNKKAPAAAAFETSTETKMVTLDLRPDLHRAFKIKAIDADKRMSNLIREMVDQTSLDKLIAQTGFGDRSEALRPVIAESKRLTPTLYPAQHRALKIAAATADVHMTDILRILIDDAVN